MSPILIGAIIAAVLFGLMIYMGIRESKGEDPLQKRLREFSERDEEIESLEELELSLSFKERVLVPMFKKLADIALRFTPEKQLEATRRRIELAGYPKGMTPASFWVQRIFLTLVLGVGAFVLFFIVAPRPIGQALGFTIGAAALGYMLPAMQLSSKINRRKKEIVKALPDALDLLTICVEAGLGFDAAMSKVVEKWDNDLAKEFAHVLRDIQLGKLRREALRDMANRVDVPDVSTFIAAIIQADQLGVSIAKILRIQSDQMRLKRRQRAQEQAQQAPVKMMIPLVFLVFPSIWIVLLGPAAIVLKNSGIGQVLGGG